MVVVVAAVVVAIHFHEVPQGPGVRNAHAMVYDELRAVTVLFGGADAASVRSDTWTWDENSWRPLAGAGPGARTFPAFVWDAARGEAVLFGGRSVLFGQPDARDTCLADTWVFRRDGWHRRNTSGPAPRAEAGIAYDRERRVVVLFGGYNDVDGERTRFADTWEWDGASWHLRAETGPAARSGVAMTYDERLQRVILFGGSGGPRADTWSWDGRRWDSIVTPEVPGRFNSVAAYDSLRRRIVRTTGWNGSTRVRETWLFDHPLWQLVATSGPGARNHSAAAFDRRRGRLVLFGGHDGAFVFGDTWEWDGRQWYERLRASPLRRLENRH